MKKSIVAGSLFAAMGSMPLAAESALDKLAGKGQEAAAAVEASANEAVSGITPAFWIAPVCAIVALIVAIVCYKLMIKAPEGSDTMKKIAGFVREGAMAYLRQQYKSLIPLNEKNI